MKNPTAIASYGPHRCKLLVRPCELLPKIAVESFHNLGAALPPQLILKERLAEPLTTPKEAKDRILSKRIARAGADAGVDREQVEDDLVKEACWAFFVVEDDHAASRHRDKETNAAFQAIGGGWRPEAVERWCQSASYTPPSYHALALLSVFLLLLSVSYTHLTLPTKA